MKFLRKTLFAIAASATLFGAACVVEPGKDSQHTTDAVYEAVMQKAPEAPGEFDITRSPAGQWFFNAIGDNGNILLLSEAYEAKASAINGVLSVEENGVHLDSYQIVETTDGDYTFVLRAKNNQVIADGGAFRTVDEAQAGIAAARDLVAGILQYKAAVTDGARFDLWRDQDDKKWYFVLRAEDGRVLVESQSYQARTGAVNGLESVRLNGKNLARYSIVEIDGDVHFIIKAGNGQEIGASTAYDSVGEAEAGIDETNALLVSERVASPW